MEGNSMIDHQLELFQQLTNCLYALHVRLERLEGKHDSTPEDITLKELQEGFDDAFLQYSRALLRLRRAQQQT